MEIAEVRITLKHLPAFSPDDAGEFLAYASIVFASGFVCTGIKVVRTPDKRTICIMPRRPRNASCIACGRHHGVVDCFCPQCGAESEPVRKDPATGRYPEGTFHDVFFPSNAACHRAIESAVLVAYGSELARSKG